jgi:hypothetical protein
VIRWGEFSPIGRLLTLGTNLKIIEVTKILGYFFHGTSCVLILKKMGWARFWAIFSQADLRVPTFEFTYVVPRENI